MATILFYVSGHGYGHAVRMAEVMRALHLRHPSWRILARTEAPSILFPAQVEFSRANFDSGVIEREAGVVMDEDATVSRLEALLLRWDHLVASESAFVREQGVDLMVADIPPIAGDIAQATGVDCIAISNFTWDWIYEPYAPQLLRRLEQGYGRMPVLLRLPFAQPDRLGVFRQIIDAPLIARKGTASVPKGGDRTRVLLGSRAQVSEEAFVRATAEAPDFHFVIPPTGDGFPDVLTSCDIVLAKLGFSMLAECIAARKPLLYPPRENFREEAILQAQVNSHIPALPIPLADFYGGNWAPYLRELKRKPTLESALRLDGAAFCAEFLSEWVDAI